LLVIGPTQNEVDVEEEEEEADEEDDNNEDDESLNQPVWA
jgi:hypothetical protein